MSNSVSVIDGSKDPNEVIVKIDVDNKPVHVEIDELEKGIDSLVFVANSLSNSVNVIDSTTNQIIENGNISESLSEPVSISINPIINRLYIVNKNFDNDNGWVSIVDYFISKDKKFNYNNPLKIPVEKSPFSSNINLINNKIYITNSYSNTVSIINGATNKVDQTLKVGTYPTSIAIDTKNSWVYVANYLDNTIPIINSTFSGKDEVIPTIHTAKFPYKVYYNPVSKLIYVTNQGPKTLSILNNTEFVSGIIYHITPKESGILDCNNININDKKYVRHNSNLSITCFIDLLKDEYGYNLIAENIELKSLQDKFEFIPSDYGNITTQVTIPQPITLPEGFWDEARNLLLTVVLAPLGLWGLKLLIEHGYNKKKKSQMNILMQRIMQIEENSKDDKLKLKNIKEEFNRIRNEMTVLLINRKITESQFDILDKKNI